MEAFYFFKFWKPNTSSTQKEDLQPFSTQSNDPNENSLAANKEEEDLEGEDSFFELELTTTVNPELENNDSNKPPKTTIPATKNCISKNPEGSYSYRFEFDPYCSFTNNAKPSKPKKTGDANSDPISKRKILPLEQPVVKPQSPISLLKSAPSFKVLAFKKSKSIARRDQETVVEVKLEGSGNFPIFGRDNSVRGPLFEDPLTPGEEESSKLGKYLKLIRPLYVKVSRKEKVGIFSGERGSSSPSSSPLTVDSSPRKDRQGNGIRAGGKRVGKSRSGDGNGSALRSPTVAVGRRDDSLVLHHHDGIQGAILHCKKSFNSSKDSSLMSRFASEEKSEVGDSDRTCSSEN